MIEKNITGVLYLVPLSFYHNVAAVVNTANKQYNLTINNAVANKHNKGQAKTDSHKLLLQLCYKNTT